MSTKVTSTHSVEISFLAGNVNVSRGIGKVVISATSLESVDHASSRLEAIGHQIVKEAQKLRAEQ